MNNPIYILYGNDECETGCSKFFGAPDLPEDFEWPTDEEDYDMDFICQINCRDACKFNSDLPETGMLYFFGCFASAFGADDAPLIEKGFQPQGNFTAIYSNSDEQSLQSGEIVNEDGEPVGFRDLKISFTDDENMCTEALHQLLGEFPNDDETEGYKLLFCLDSFSGDDFTLEFEDSGYLYFLIKEKDFENKDFSKVICYLSV